MTRRPRVFSIPPGRPFVDALASGIMAGALGISPDPLALSEVTVLLPTRRAGRALIEAFLRQTAGRPLVLPRIMPLGDVEEDALDLAAELGEGAGEIPPAIPQLRREMLLARLIIAWHKARGRALGADQAMRFARELARLIDQVHTEGLTFEGLSGLVPEDFAAHWQITLDFLALVTDRWPKILAQEGCVDPATRRNLLLDAQAKLWERAPPAQAVIAAGSTGSIPATARLLAVIASLPNGAVVLPGLDRALDEESWAQLDDTHPQFTMARLLSRFGISRSQVGEWDSPGVEATPPGRAALASQAMRPAATTERWSRFRQVDPAALSNVARIDCPTSREEAGVIALLMREALETEGERAALVTPDRGLARRVAAELRRFGLEVDDSGGQELSETPPGVYLRLTAAMVAERLSPVPFVSALKHPLASGGLAPGAFRASVREFERAVLRGPRPAPWFKGLRAALRVGGLDAKAKRRLSSFVSGLETAAKPFVKLMARKRAALADLIAAHLAFAEALAAGDVEKGAARLWAGEAGEAAGDLLAELAQSARDWPPIATLAYPAFLETALGGQVVRPRFGRHPRLFIWGLLEARLQHAERMILGGLNEETWPAAARADPWMSRPMRVAFGLPPPERRIGLSAHDFVQAFCAPEVALTRAARIEGSPSVPSRWLLRLDAVLAPDRKIPRAARYLEWFGALDDPGPPAPVAAPAPKPPAESRPREIRVTEVETLIRDPYAIYARRILRLEPLDPLDANPGAAERGSFIHEALDRFIAAHRDLLPDDAEAQLIAFAEKSFGAALERPGVRAFWWPRFLRIAGWFVEFERRRRASGVAVLATECRGIIEIPTGAVPVLLKAKADRIDRAATGLSILDYKTGLVPSTKQIKAGLAPQLPLEAAIAAQGGFADIPASSVAELAYIRLTGREPPGEEALVDGDPAELAAAALEGLTRLLAAFARPATPYLSRPRPLFARKSGDYDHLARVKEWSAGLGDGE
jgi:ATP-dependent helicase/nuclease subunit B